MSFSGHVVEQCPQSSAVRSGLGISLLPGGHCRPRSFSALSNFILSFFNISEWNNKTFQVTTSKDMNCTRCLTTVSPNLFNTQQLNLNHIGVNETISKLNCDNCQVCIYVSMSTEEWKNVDSLLHEKKRLGGNGWEVIGEKDELVKLYVLGQIVYNEIEGRLDDFHVVFDFPDKTDLVKILWEDGNAIGFYTLKLKDSIVFDTMEAYEMTTLDTAYIRKAYRRNGFGLSILEDVVQSFPDEDIGISTPVSPSMYYVIHKFLMRNPSYKTKLWEITGVGSEGNRKLIYFSLKKLFDF